MPRFSYKAIDAADERVAGEIDAASMTHAVDELHGRGWRVLSIGAADLAEVREPTPPIQAFDAERVAADEAGGEGIEQTVLQNHMDTILQSGGRLAPALRAYAEEMPASWRRRQLLNVCRILERGRSPDAVAALAALPECWIPLLSAAKSSRDPGRVLESFLSESQRADELRHKWWLTLVYPIVLVGLAVTVMTLLSIFIIPGFAQVIRSFHIKQLWLTRYTIEFSSFMATWGIPLLVVIGILLGALVLDSYRMLPTQWLPRLADRLGLPFGRRTAIARFARFTADLLDAGVRMPDALRIAGYAVNKSRVRRAAWQLALDLDSPGDVSQLNYRRDLTSTVTLALVSPFSETSRVRLLREVSDCHAELVRGGMSWTIGIVEPVAICVVGLIVGGTVLALFLPLISLLTGLSS